MYSLFSSVFCLQLLYKSKNKFLYSRATSQWARKKKKRQPILDSTDLLVCDFMCNSSEEGSLLVAILYRQPYTNPNITLLLKSIYKY